MSKKPSNLQPPAWANYKNPDTLYIAKKVPYKVLTRKDWQAIFAKANLTEQFYLTACGISLIVSKLI